jgi:hypothetical protein
VRLFEHGLTFTALISFTVGVRLIEESESITAPVLSIMFIYILPVGFVVAGLIMPERI